MRNLEREIGAACRKVARRVAEGEHARKVNVTAPRVRELLGRPRFQPEARRRTQQPGVATGLAWTPVGGDVLFVEADRDAGQGQADRHRAARRRDEGVGAGGALVGARVTPTSTDDWFAKHDLHLHVPAGAMPKDGPSAGVTMATALMSLVSGRPVRDDIAMTGEITLTGQVLPIGGLKEKALAAQRAGITRVIAPRRNEPDLEDIPEHLRRGPRVRLGRRGRGGARRGARAARGGFARRARPGYARRGDATRPMRGGMGAKKKAAKAGAAAVAVTRSPYVQRIAEDEELRQNLWSAYESARDAVGRLQNGKHPTKQIFDDKRLQKDMKSAAEAFKDASVALHEAPNRSKKRKGRASASCCVIGIVGGGDRARRVRGPAQEAARRAVRRRGGVRVHLDDRPAATPPTPASETAGSTS